MPQPFDKLSAQGQPSTAPLMTARALLARRRRPARTWPALAAAVCFAASATAFAAVTILAPAPIIDRPALRD